MKDLPGATYVITPVQLIFDKTNRISFPCMAEKSSQKTSESQFSENQSAFLVTVCHQHIKKGEAVRNLNLHGKFDVWLFKNHVFKKQWPHHASQKL